MPHLRPYAEKDWQHFFDLELETQLDSLGESTELERATLRLRVAEVRRRPERPRAAA